MEGNNEVASCFAGEEEMKSSTDPKVPFLSLVGYEACSNALTFLMIFKWLLQSPVLFPTTPFNRVPNAIYTPLWYCQFLTVNSRCDENFYFYGSWNYISSSFYL